MTQATAPINSDTPGSLYIVPTPIGNLEDITLRALRVLREVPIVACEDTRVTGKLLHHFEIPHKRLISYFVGNEQQRVAQIIAALASGSDVALVSDAGTPGISDPGARLVAAAIAAGITVVPLPGPTAVIAALVASGLPTDSVAFDGFLPHKKGRQSMLQRLAGEERTIVLYESPHRIVRTLRELAEQMGEDRPAVVAREITKMHEEISRGTLGRLRDDYAARPSIRGEFVVVLGGAPAVRRRRRDAVAEDAGCGDDQQEEGTSEEEE